MELDEKLDNFYKSAIEDATEQSISMIEEYKNSLHTIYEEHKAQALKKSTVDFHVGSDELLREKNKILSNTLLQNKRILSETTIDLINTLFDDIVSKLNDYKKTPEYRDLLVKQILEAKNLAGNEQSTIYIDPSDEALKTEVESNAECKLILSTVPFLGGIRMVIHSKNILVDNSFSSKIIEQKNTFTL